MIVSPSDQVSLTSLVSQDDIVLRRAVAVLGSDWQLLNPAAPSGPAMVAVGTSLPAVLANSAYGVILLDIAPRISPAAVEQFRAMLGNAGFVQVFSGNLPVVHRALPPEHLSRLPDIIDYAFSWESPITVRDDVAWIEMVRILLTGVPVDAGVRVSAENSGNMRDEAVEAHNYSAPATHRSSSVLLFAGCGLLVALSGATMFMAAKPREAPHVLTAGDNARLTVPMVSSGSGWKDTEPPTIIPSLTNQGSASADAASTSPEPLHLANSQPVEALSSRLDEQTKAGISVPSITIQNMSGPKQTSDDVAAAASPIGDVPMAEPALIASEQVLGPDNYLSGVTLVRPEDVAAAVPGVNAASDASTDAQQLIVPNGSAADVVPVPTDNVSGMSTETEAVVTTHATRPETPQPTQEIALQATSPSIALATVENSVVQPRAGTIESLPSGLRGSPDALLSTLLRRGDAMLALGDVSAARLFYERAAATGSGRSATALGKTYDREVLAQLGARGIAGDATMAARWYRVALTLGDAEAGPLLSRIEHSHP